MNEIEQKSLALKRKAWEVMDTQSTPDELFAEMHRIERHSPELFEQIVAQMEADNGRWSETSQLPNVIVKRGNNGRVEEIAFAASNAQKTLTWSSDYSDQLWLEDFAKQLTDESK